MTILVKKVFISSKPTFVCLLCPPLCGPFSIQESAAGGLSYKAKKIRQNTYPKVSCRIKIPALFFELFLQLKSRDHIAPLVDSDDLLRKFRILQRFICINIFEYVVNILRHNGDDPVRA